MSQSPLARKRKSLTAFSRAPSQLSRSVTASALDEVASPSSSPSRPSSDQNAFATPPRERRSRRERESLPEASFRESPRDSVRDSSRRSTLGYSPTGTPTPAPRPHRIVYSPYATPPAGLSRSSSIPFNMAASSEAARKTEERLRAAVPGGTPKKPRYVRRRPLWKRIVESPGNALDTALFHVPTSVEEMLPPARWANPLALAFYVVHWLLLAPLRAVKPDAVLKGERGVVDSIGNRWERREAGARSGVAGTRVAFLYTFLLLVLAGANAAWLFTRYRTYDMQLRSGKDPLRSPHASPVPAPKVRPADGRPEGLPAADEAPLQKVARLVGTGLWALIKWAYRSILGAIGARPPSTITGMARGDSIQSLRVWDPPEFCLAFFCAMPPGAPLIAYFLTSQHPFLTPLILAVAAAVMSHLAACFTQLIKDRMLLSAEVMREYDQRFVYKRVFAPMVDRGVGTSDAVMLP
ncbi:uncharacterized protein CcaverHIS019_0502870 [Cutaneotrichosporon cavernicola]|uniref:Nuclear rim protein 1 n=1 Tax=Cutaneotrichosporon cavernicola TaxID=279322 RepID=A0AA48L627_9TREE|nr:uncharacterized protein CcaverHIS019_0502870 [Cutaneotrichosporon cavernicola]BEI92659.1 hypothetical protein CcaverHIS019_0502870 [Cutaneotrichosporon cavernicola]